MSDTETVIATQCVEGTPILDPDEFVNKGYINMIRFRIRHNILFIQNHIQILEQQLLEEQAKIEVINEILGEEQTDSEEEFEDIESDILEGSE